MKKILLVLVSVFVIGCEHDDCHDHCHYRDCDYYPPYPPPYSMIHNVREYLEYHKADVPSSNYRSYFSRDFNVYGPVYCSNVNPRMGNVKIERLVDDHVNLETDYNYIYSYTKFYYPPTGEEYYIVEYYKNW